MSGYLVRYERTAVVIRHPNSTFNLNLSIINYNFTIGSQISSLFVTKDLYAKKDIDQ